MVVGTGVVGKGGLAVWEYFLLPALGAMGVVMGVGVIGKGGLAVREQFLFFIYLCI